jgi:hypothetical protein
MGSDCNAPGFNTALGSDICLCCIFSTNALLAWRQRLLIYIWVNLFIHDIAIERLMLLLHTYLNYLSSYSIVLSNVVSCKDLCGII